MTSELVLNYTTDEQKLIIDNLITALECDQFVESEFSTLFNAFQSSVLILDSTSIAEQVKVRDYIIGMNLTYHCRKDLPTGNYWTIS